MEIKTSISDSLYSTGFYNNFDQVSWKSKDLKVMVEWYNIMSLYMLSG
jgi:hypothetical protein